VPRELVVARDNVKFGACSHLQSGALGVAAFVLGAVECRAFAPEHVEPSLALDGAALVADDVAAIDRLAGLRTDPALQRRDEEHGPDLVLLEIRRHRPAREQRVGPVVFVFPAALSEDEGDRGPLIARAGRTPSRVVEVVADDAGALYLQAVAAIRLAQPALRPGPKDRCEIPGHP